MYKLFKYNISQRSLILKHFFLNPALHLHFPKSLLHRQKKSWRPLTYTNAYFISLLSLSYNNGTEHVAYTTQNP
jgi:hypothetical protein